MRETRVRSLDREDPLEMEMIPWRRKWQPTPVFLLGESHGERSLVGYSPCSLKESDMTERCSGSWKKRGRKHTELQGSATLSSDQTHKLRNTLQNWKALSCWEK